MQYEHSFYPYMFWQFVPFRKWVRAVITKREITFSFGINANALIRIMLAILFDNFSGCLQFIQFNYQINGFIYT